MDQHFDNTRYDFLWTLLANPANNADAHANNLQLLIADFPQSGLLQALQVCYSEDKNLKRAAVYFNGGSLYKLIKAPHAFKDVPANKIIVQTGTPGKAQYKIDAPNNEPVFAENSIENYFSEQGTEEAAELPASVPATEAAIAYNATTVESNDDILNKIETPAPPDQETEFTGDTEEETIVADENKDVAANEAELLTAIDNNDEYIEIPEFQNNTDEEQTIDEVKQLTLAQESAEGLAEPVVLEAGLPEEAPVVNNPEDTKIVNTNSETDKLIVDSIAATDYFMFDRAFGKHKNGKSEEADIPLTNANTSAKPEALPLFTADPETEKVSKYHDDKMPYTFMWWLDKTRKEHGGVYQPYASPAMEPAIAQNDTNNKLEQQYYENIFHINSVEDLENSTASATQTIEFDMKRKELVKEHIIINRFLKEEPQIKPQSSDKLGNENKAKKSSEDKDEEMVTETLASIYTDQMLYHKAIAAYKKLVLKFPEKSLYFADKIEQLEKKTN